MLIVYVAQHYINSDDSTVMSDKDKFIALLQLCNIETVWLFL